MKLDKTKLTYGSLAVVAIISAIVGGVLIFEDSTGTTYYLSYDGAQAIYECSIPLMKSDCINGLKTEDTRCYYNPDNGRNYKVCSDGWKIIQPKENNPSKDIILPNGDNSNKIICDNFGCSVN